MSILQDEKFNNSDFLSKVEQTAEIFYSLGDYNFQTVKFGLPFL